MYPLVASFPGKEFPLHITNKILDQVYSLCRCWRREKSFCSCRELNSDFSVIQHAAYSLSCSSFNFSICCQKKKRLRKKLKRNNMCDYYTTDEETRVTFCMRPSKFIYRATDILETSLTPVMVSRM